MSLAAGSIAAVGGIVIATKSLLKNYKRPNGKKGGILSFHVATAFAILTTIAMITQDWFITGLAVILAYLIARGRMDESQHYTYQVVLSAILGIVVPAAVWYYASRKQEVVYEREDYADMPSSAVDDRHEADEFTELKLEDIE